MGVRRTLNGRLRTHFSDFSEQASSDGDAMMMAMEDKLEREIDFLDF